ncbi:formate--tetrahydrofolate ligase [Anoxybacillus flavithermus NBRC 109594]|uniref:Formate--tetrahydrofolate ligase n=1 Tax=Anoxybacillus flavithermus NBRC 109594 TaxID=1315967 RepID=R4G6T2_9BACL|nr:formate--tetrahydrofolate ligase [Anoxybacillus flavithermus NBRC 109594]
MVQQTFLTSDVMTMAGLPKQPVTLQIDVDEYGNACGLF